MSKIEIYTSENCPYCKQIKEHLTEKKIDFKNMDIVTEENIWKEIVNLTGLPTVPTIKFKGEYFVPGRDYGSPDHLVSILESFEKPSYDDARRVFERVKTLGFQINNAFGAVDRLLKQIETNTKKEEDEAL